MINVKNQYYPKRHVKSFALSEYLIYHLILVTGGHHMTLHACTTTKVATAIVWVFLHQFLNTLCTPTPNFTQKLLWPLYSQSPHSHEKINPHNPHRPLFFSPHNLSNSFFLFDMLHHVRYTSPPKHHFSLKLHIAPHQSTFSCSSLPNHIKSHSSHMTMITPITTSCLTWCTMPFQMSCIAPWSSFS